ncbi:Hypothetical protein GSB_9239 [Giardia duodenalis]|uniref:Nif3-related protein n=2 Tax=Giardia intestinalis TaxID=5741 RepID=C6LZL0_GIAIB|nr:Nif3-related protein [Giardia intestinalis ATCC 50581]ESU45288.1 Hypothetical protein GSB_9239 [Giardia intestinalis]
MSVSRDQLLKFLSETYEAQPDGQHNGLQVEGKKEIRTLVTGVSLCGDLINEAIRKNADAILVHHGFFGKSFLRVTDSVKTRLAPLLKYDINLFAYHLPMDAHPIIGHNSQLCKAAGLLIETFYSCGCYCKNPDRLSGLEIIRKLSEFCDRTAYAVNAFVLQQKDLCSSTFCGTRIWSFNSSFAADSPPRRIYLCSGGSSSLIDEIDDVDLFIFGEPKESAISTARDRGISMVALGHWRSEQAGLWAIGDLISKQFSIAVEYIPITCDV